MSVSYKKIINGMKIMNITEYRADLGDGRNFAIGTGDGETVEYFCLYRQDASGIKLGQTVIFEGCKIRCARVLEPMKVGEGYNVLARELPDVDPYEHLDLPNLLDVFGIISIQLPELKKSMEARLSEIELYSKMRTQKFSCQVTKRPQTA